MPVYTHNNTFVELEPQIGLPRLGGGNSAVFESFGTLYKHCEKIYLPQPGRSIRLGTLTEYRRNENVAIRDEHEGTFNFSLNFPAPTTIKIEAIKRVTLATSPLIIGNHLNNVYARSFFGLYTSGSLFSTAKVNILQRSEDDITLSGNINLHAEGADAWLLCLSASDAFGTTIHDAGYDSIWSILPGVVLDFAQHLVDGI